MEVVDDVCESEGLCEVMCDALSGQPQHESMETHVSEEEPAHLANSAPSLEDAQLPGAAHSDVNAQKPRFSYRLVLSQLGYNQNYYYLFIFFCSSNSCFDSFLKLCFQFDLVDLGNFLAIRFPCYNFKFFNNFVWSVGKFS